MLVIGLTGTIGSGKSEVARIARSNGIPVISSDDVARHIMDTDPEVRAALQHRFGNQIVPDSSPISRQHLAELMFGNTAEHIAHRRFVEQLVHPRVLESIACQLDELARTGTPMAIVESALIYTAGIEHLFDYVVAVVAPEDIRRERVRLRGSTDDFDRRNDTQLPDAQLRDLADFTIVNDGTLDELEDATKTVLTILRQLPPRPVEPAEDATDEQATG
ncbi:MAG: dephospho-CoA kinase [Chlorobi bacterium]|nr:dephospho-CoA kinase [Chlorobiota bacterium]